MLLSMTGYGRKKAESERYEILAEIRSVNHRYLDLGVKVPRIYSFLEDEIKKRVSGFVSRGKVDVYLSVKTRGGGDIAITPNMAVIDGYVRAFNQVKEAYGLADELSALSLLRLPDVLSTDREEADAAVLLAEVMPVLESALNDYQSMRRAEGRGLCEDISTRTLIIEEYVAQIEARSPDSVAEHRERIAARMEELLDGSEIAQSRVLAEAAVFADKVAVTEEIVRLKSHLAQLCKLLQSSNSVGRKLDFLVQEMNREANTIGSKANDYEISKIVIDLKAEIEKIREQVQNLE